MTIHEFRSNPGYTKRLREILSDETMQLALITLRDSNTPREVSGEETDAVASVRRLSRIVGFNTALALFLGMGEPINPPEPEEEAKYEAEAL